MDWIVCCFESKTKRLWFKATSFEDLKAFFCALCCGRNDKLKTSLFQFQYFPPKVAEKLHNFSEDIFTQTEKSQSAPFLGREPAYYEVFGRVLWCESSFCSDICIHIWFFSDTVAPEQRFRNCSCFHSENLIFKQEKKLYRNQTEILVTFHTFKPDYNPFKLINDQNCHTLIDFLNSCRF